MKGKEVKKRGNNTKYFDEDKWEKVNEDNKQIMEEFLSSKRSLSDASLKQYRSSLTIFLIWVLDGAKNNFIVDLKKRDVLRFQNWMLDNGLSPNSAKTRRSHISSLCNYITDYYEDEYPEFKNITVGIEKLIGEPVHKKEPLNPKEIKNLRKKLIEMEKWQQLAYFDISYSTAGRRAEIHQLRKEIANYEPNEMGYYTTHDVRAKGASKLGNVRPLNFSKQAKESIEKWLEVRGEDDEEHIFVSMNKDGEVKHINETSFNYWCSSLFSEIVGRRVHPHSLRAARATNLVVSEGKDIASAQHLLSHKDSATTEIYVIRDSTESINDCF